MSAQNIFRNIPKVDLLLEELRRTDEYAHIPHVHLVSAIRLSLEGVRRDMLDGLISAPPDREKLWGRIKAELENEMSFSLRPVINATGIVLHTNLGRSVLSREAAGHVARVAGAYSTLEYDSQNGTRGSRHQHLENILTRLCGAEAAMAVNNNAAAVLLILTALFSGREVIVSRGELVEIGGAFRVPDIMEQGGAILKEVGCTNRTRLSDYARAIVPGLTGGLMKVHTSNYRLIGFTEETSLAELSRLARERELPLVCDLGSGSFIDLSPLGIHDEPTVPQIMAEGVDLACFSGDKLMGGAQAGLIVGRRELIDRLKQHPLARAVRVDKLTLAALEATLRFYLDPDLAKKNIPTLAMLFADPRSLKIKAEKLRDSLAGLYGLKLECLPTESLAGGGSAPERPLPSWAVSVICERLGPDGLEAALRSADPPIIARIASDRLLLDVRTIDEADFGSIIEAFRRLNS